MSSLIPVYYQLSLLDSVHFHPSEFCIWKCGDESTESAFCVPVLINNSIKVHFKQYYKELIGRYNCLGRFSYFFKKKIRGQWKNRSSWWLFLKKVIQSISNQKTLDWESEIRLVELNLPFRSISIIMHKVVVERRPIAGLRLTTSVSEWKPILLITDLEVRELRWWFLLRVTTWLQSDGDQGWSRLKAFSRAHLVLSWGVESSCRLVGCLYVSLSCWSIHVDVLNFLTAWWSQGSLASVRGMLSREHEHGLTLQLAPGNQRLLSPSLVLGIYALPTVPPGRDISRTQPWESQLVLGPGGLNMWLNQLRVLYKCLRFGR